MVNFLFFFVSFLIILFFNNNIRFRNFDGKFIIDRFGNPYLAEEDLDSQIQRYLNEKYTNI